MRSEAIPYIAATLVVFAVAVVVFLEPLSPRLRRVSRHPEVWMIHARRPIKAGTVLRASRGRRLLVAVLVALDARRDDRRRRAARNGKPTTAELEAIASVELDREARQS